MRTQFLTTVLLCLTLTACKDSDKKESTGGGTPPSATTPAKPTAPSAAEVPAAAPPAEAASGEWTKKVQAGQDVYATLETNQGAIVVRLFSKDAPKTVANFVGLATGEKAWTDPKTGQRVEGKPLYDGVIFHRVIPGFMIQGGDPTGTGRGDPGFNVEDEYQSGRTFDKVGLLATANVGRPNTNGSQFFITTSKPTYLNNKHTIFGEVLSGYDVVEKIANVQRDPRDKPLEPVVIQKIAMSDQAPAGSGN